jgi:ERCC4-type nuclease
MILIDRRIGSGDLINVLPPDSAQLTTLEYGDCAFLGNGPGGAPVRVGIEIKALGDCAQSIRSGRFAGHQLPGLLANYDKVYVILEGLYRAGTEGELETFTKGHWTTGAWGGCGWMYNELDGWINSINIVAGVTVKRTMSRRETAAVIFGLHHWWTSKSYEKHRSHCGFDESGRPTLMKPGLVRRVAAELPLIGWERSSAVADEFQSVLAMVLAEESSWIKIKGIGKGIARKVVRAIRGEEDE